MTLVALLLGYAVVVACASPLLLSRASWVRRAPAAGVLVWQAAGLSVLVALLLGVAALCASLRALTPQHFVTTCVRMLTTRDAWNLGAVVLVIGLSAAAGVVVRLALSVGRQARAARRDRSALRAMVAAAATPRGAVPGAVVIDRPLAGAFCLPSRRGGQIVVTTGALEQLSTDELVAVLAHERAHLRGRHHLLMASAYVLRDALPFVPIFRHAARAVADLVEMAADDAAARRTSRRCVASAVVRMASAGAPASALGAGGSTAVLRARRLLADAPAARGLPLPLLGGAAAALVLVSLPLMFAVLVPGASCPFPMTAS